MKFNVVIAVCAMILFVACNGELRKTSENDLNDIKLSEPYLYKFYGYIGENKYDSLFSYFSISGQDTIIRKQRLRIEKVLGTMEGFECYELYSKRTEIKQNVMKAPLKP